MECACIDMYDGDAAEFHHEKVVKARKQHRCGECGRTIEPGEQYETVFGKWDGSVSTYKTCCDCLSVREAFFCTWYYGNIWWDIDEYLEPGECLSKALLKVTPAAREKIGKRLSERAEEEEEEDSTGA